MTGSYPVTTLADINFIVACLIMYFYCGSNY